MPFSPRGVPMNPKEKNQLKAISAPKLIFTPKTPPAGKSPVTPKIFIEIQKKLKPDFGPPNAYTAYPPQISFPLST